MWAKGKTRGSAVRIEQFLTGALVAFVVSSLSPVAAAQRVWGEGSLATVLVGADPANKAPVREKLMLVAIGPDTVEPSIHHARFAACMKKSVVNLVETERLRNGLDLSVKPWPTMAADIRQAGQPVNANTLNAARAARLQQVSAVFADARKRFLSQMAGCGLPQQLVERARLAIVNRVCLEAALNSCTGNDYLTNPEYSSASRYSKVYEWFQSAGVRRENDFLEIGPDASLTPVSIANELYADKPWPAPRSAEQVQRAFEAGAVRMRNGKTKYDYIAPRVVGLPKETGYRLVDVIANPSLSVLSLLSAPSGTPALISISDEIARSRITECVLLRAKRDPADVGKCAGYGVDMATMANCMSGKTCVPPLSAEGYASVLEHVTVRTGRQLLETSLPRLTNSNMRWGQYAAAADECKKQPRVQAAICMSRAGLNPDDQKTLDCASKVVAKNGGTRDVGKCLLDAMREGPDKELAKCATGDLNDHKTMVLCATLPNAPPAVKAGVACMEQFLKLGKKQAALNCVQGNPLVSADLAKAAECMNKYPNDWRAAAVCFESGKSLPVGSDEAVKCASAANDYKQFGGCMVTTKLFGNAVGGDGGRLINCAAQSGGDGLGTMACMGGSSLTPEQQIALQCAAQSPDLLTFAGCTGGQLSLREFMKCQGHEFGDDVCFGPNNEIRKFLNAFGIDVGKETVLGKIANANLNVLKAQVAFAEAAGKEIGKVGEAVFHAAEAIGQAAGSIVVGLLEGGQSVVNGLKNAFGI